MHTVPSVSLQAAFCVYETCGRAAVLKCTAPRSDGSPMESMLRCKRR